MTSSTLCNSIKTTLIFLAALSLSSTVFGQAFKSFNAGPFNGKYTICAGDFIEVGVLNFVYSPKTPDFVIDWLDSPVPPSQKNNLTPKFELNEPGTHVFRVKLLDQISGIALIDSFTIFVIGTVEIDAGPDLVLFSGESNTFGVISTNFQRKVQWTHNGTGELQNATSFRPTYLPGAEETGKITFIITVLGVSDCGDVSDTICLEYLASPSVKIISNPDTICNPGEVQLTAIAENYSGFEWKVISGITKNLKNSDTLTPTYIVSPGEEGLIEIMLEVFQLAGSLRASSVATFSAELMLAPGIEAGPDRKLVTGDSHRFSSKSSGYYNSIKWTHNGNGELSDATTLQPTYHPALNEFGQLTFVVSIYGAGACGAVSDTVLISYLNEPICDIVTATTTICSPGQLQLTAIAENYTNFQWRIPTGQPGKLMDTNTLSPTYKAAAGEQGKAHVILDVFSDLGAVSDTLTLNISSIKVSALPDTTLCEGSTLNIGVESYAGLRYLWSTGSKMSFVTFNNLKSSQNHSLEIWNAEGCYYADTFFVEVLPAPHFAVTNNETDQILTVEPPGMQEYVFYVGEDTLQAGISNSFFYTNYLEWYEQIYVKVASEDGCSSLLDQSVLIKVEQPPAVLKKVDAFSPNGDGINDRLLPGWKTQVIDRNHKIIYEGWEGWDGRYNGKEMPMGTYFYLVYNESGQLFYKGPVSIIR